MTDWTTSTHMPYMGSTRNPYTIYTLHVEHGILDEKARNVGGTANIFACTENTWHNAEHHGQWVLTVSATRNGHTYGASARAHLEPTFEAAQARCMAMLAAQAKSYARKYGRGGQAGVPMLTDAERQVKA